MEAVCLVLVPTLSPESPHGSTFSAIHSSPPLQRLKGQVGVFCLRGRSLTHACKIRRRPGGAAGQLLSRTFSCYRQLLPCLPQLAGTAARSSWRPAIRLRVGVTATFGLGTSTRVAGWVSAPRPRCPLLHVTAQAGPEGDVTRCVSG